MKDIEQLASYVTYRQLYNDGKRDVYFVISKFVENIIISCGLYAFGLTEMSEKIKTQFGFDIPEYVIRSSIKRLNYVIRSSNTYSVKKDQIPEGNDAVPNSIAEARSVNEKITNELVAYVEDKTGLLSIDEKNKLIKEFCSFLLDDTMTNGFSQYISAYIINNEQNVEVQRHIAQIKEGAVLFAGLNYNSNIADNSAWKDELIIYVENEILFHLAGYNGQVFQQLAEELFGLIGELNQKSKKRVIKVRYFKEVGKEVDAFFDRAVEIVEGKGYVGVDNYAMSEIVRGCHSAADVVDKKAKFYALLRNKQILQEKEKDYYTDELHEYNLESKETVEKYQISDDKHRYIQHLSYVNILRKSICYTDLKKCRYIVLTETGKILKMASEFCGDSKNVPLAINMNVLTNRLWYDLNKGFGAKDFPTTFDVLVKSRIVLSRILTQNVAEKYDQVRLQYINREIDEDQLADNILFLREEVKKPEDIKGNLVDDALDFISEEKLIIHQSEKELLSNKLQEIEKEKDSLANVIRNQDKKEKEYQKQITEQTETLQKENRRLVERQEEDLIEHLKDLETHKEKADDKIDSFMGKVKVAIIVVIVFYYIAVLILFLKGNDNIRVIIPGLLAIIPPFVSAILSLVYKKKVEWLELYNKALEIIRRKYQNKIYEEYSIQIDKITELKNRLKQV